MGDVNDEVIKYLVKLDNRISKIELNYSTKEDINRVMDGVDRVLKELIDMRTEHSTLTLRVDDHDVKINKLEAATTHTVKK